jgi:hypothetical protein
MAKVALAEASSKDAMARVAEAQRASVEASAKAEGFRLDIAKANERASAADLARRRLEMQLAEKFANRIVTPEQIERLANALRQHKGSTVDLVITGDTPEINQLSES